MMDLDLNHVDEELLEKYSLGRLPDSEVASLEEHLLVCGLCRVQLDAIDVYVRAMRGAMRASAQTAPVASKYKDWLHAASARWTLAPIAALALLGVAGNQFLNRASNTPVRVDLFAMRGETPSRAGIANRPLDLFVDARGLPLLAQYRLQVVDNSGKSIWEGFASPDGVTLHSVAKPRLAAGSYFVRAYGPGSDALREYSLLIR